MRGSERQRLSEGHNRVVNALHESVRHSSCPTVSEGFLADMDSVSERLQIRWNSAKGRYEVWEVRERGTPYHILTVRDTDIRGADDGFRPLDGRTILRLRMADVWRTSPARFVRLLEEQEESVERQRGKSLSDDVEAITRENYNRVFDVKSIVNTWRGAGATANSRG